MASTKREGVKRTLLLSFITISVVLIGMIWADGLVSEQPATPSYYRDSYQMDPNTYLTITAEAQEMQNQANGTPAPAEENHGSGGGQGQGQGRGSAATPTPTETPIP